MRGATELSFTDPREPGERHDLIGQGPRLSVALSDAPQGLLSVPRLRVGTIGIGAAATYHRDELIEIRSARCSALAKALSATVEQDAVPFVAGVLGDKVRAGSAASLNSARTRYSKMPSARTIVVVPPRSSAALWAVASTSDVRTDESTVARRKSSDRAARRHSALTLSRR